MVKVGQKYKSCVSSNCIYTVVNVFQHEGNTYVNYTTKTANIGPTTPLCCAESGLLGVSYLVVEDPRVGEVWFGKNSSVSRTVENVFTSQCGERMVVYKSGDIGSFEVATVDKFVEMGEKT